MKLDHEKHDRYWEKLSGEKPVYNNQSFDDALLYAAYQSKNDGISYYIFPENETFAVRPYLPEDVIGCYVGQVVVFHNPLFGDRCLVAVRYGELVSC